MSLQCGVVWSLPASYLAIYDGLLTRATPILTARQSTRATVHRRDKAHPHRILPSTMFYLPTRSPKNDLRLFGYPLESKTAMLMAGNPPIKVRRLAPTSTILNLKLDLPEVWFEALRLRIYDSPPQS